MQQLVDDSSIKGNCGIAHTRWATHGAPNDITPHLDHTGSIALVHNGIFENYETIKQLLVNRDVQFTSDTDTEVIVQLISELYYNNDEKLTFEDVRAALQEVVGAYGIVTVCVMSQIK